MLPSDIGTNYLISWFGLVMLVFMWVFGQILVPCGMLLLILTLSAFTAPWILTLSPMVQLFAIMVSLMWVFLLMVVFSHMMLLIMFVLVLMVVCFAMDEGGVLSSLSVL
jgi:hypothetical protein